MVTSINAEFVNAILGSVLETLQRCGERRAHLGKPRLVSEVPHAPYRAVGIELRGAAEGPIVWAFMPAIAAALTRHLFPCPQPDDASLAPSEDALAELSNILLGNAAEALRQAGFAVELSPPTPVRALGTLSPLGRTLSIPVLTSHGHIEVLMAVHLTAAR